MAGQRPGGLTALAVLNFIFGGFGLIGSLVYFLGISALKMAGDGMGELAAKHGGTVNYTGPSITMAYIHVLLMLLGGIFLIVSGVGFIGQKRFSGKTIGTIYGLVSIAGTVVGIMTYGFGPFAIVGIIYPVLILIMENVTYKNHLVN
jgi:hypothetical protein